MRLLVCFSLFFGFMLQTWAQDLHFTQFYNAPLAQNPALTGKFEGDYKFFLLHRNQWKMVNAAYISTYAAAEINFTLNENDLVGVGLLFMNDEVGNGLLKNQYYTSSFSYIKTLDRLKRHKLSVGMQPGYVRKNISKDGMIFGNQINTSTYQYDPNLPSNENFNSASYFNLNIGTNWDYKIDDKLDLFAGIAIFNANKPKEVSRNNTSKLGTRWNSVIGLNYQFLPALGLLPSFQYTFQEGAKNVNFGAALCYSILNGKLSNTDFFIGSWYRTNDALMPTFGLRHKNYKLFCSYDATFGSAKKLNEIPAYQTRVGALEISLTYYGFLSRAVPKDITIPSRFF